MAVIKFFTGTKEIDWSNFFSFSFPFFLYLPRKKGSDHYHLCQIEHLRPVCGQFYFSYRHKEEQKKGCVVSTILEVGTVLFCDDESFEEGWHNGW